MLQRTYVTTNVRYNERMLQRTYATTNVCYNERMLQRTYATTNVCYNERMLQRTNSTTNEILESITFVLAYPTVFTVQSQTSNRCRTPHYDDRFISNHCICNTVKSTGGPGSVAGYSDWRRAGRPGDRILVGGEIFHICPDRSWLPPSLLYNRHRVFTERKERLVRDADPSPPSSAVGHERVELYLYSPLWAVRPVQSLSACTRVTFTFTFY